MTDKDVITVVSTRFSYQFPANWTLRLYDSEPITSNAFSMSVSPKPVVCVGDRYTPAVNGIIGFILVLIAIGTAGGNFLVILAVALVKKLQTPSNILIVSLAFSDFLVGILVLPFSIIDALRGYWPFNEHLCDMYISFDVLLCTASILNLCAISIDRYLVITRPFTYVSRRTPCRMAEMIAAAWVISALISIPPNIGWKTPFEKCKCEYSKNVGYQIYATFCAFYLPLLVMIVLYGRIFKLAREMSRAEQRQMIAGSAEEAPAGTGEGKDENMEITSKSDRTTLNRSSVLCRQNDMRSADSPLCLQKMEISNENSNTTTNYSILKNGTNETHGMANSGQTHFVVNQPVTPELRNGRSFAKSIRVSKDSSTAFLDRSSGNVAGNRQSSSVDLQRRKSRGSADSKVIKTLGVIMGCFCLCWLPFFIVQVRSWCMRWIFIYTETSFIRLLRFSTRIPLVLVILSSS
ncbi:5-hydroxytryptamine receptor 7 [Fasciolopsis buskii]|uniref:5-hydroxytryptamine receptor 7 n=1 Tax=Fasciolopsis buskii TaxID=27845 RepID=A0A8E0VG04_9TREM|nr:5-hydroxytryptamine receptor 7 [Fasciolopsis buski]